MASALSELQLELNNKLYQNHRLSRTLNRASDILFRSLPQAEKELSLIHFQLTDISWLTFKPQFTVECFMKGLLEGLSNKKIDLQEHLLCCNGLPSPLLGEVPIQALEGVNTAKLCDDYYLLWAIPYDKHPQPFLVILDIKTNQAFVGTTPIQFRVWDYSTLESISYVFERCLPASITHFNSVNRSQYLSALSKSNDLVHIPEICPPHIGHYVLNNLSHVSRLEEQGLLKYFTTIFRLSSFVYLGVDEKVICFDTETQPKIQYTENFETALRQLSTRKAAAICSKDSSLGNHLVKNVNNYFSSVPKSIVVSDKEPSFTICVGVRGGTREAINLADVVRIMVLEIMKQTKLPVSIIVDGMSKSINNSLTTTRNISPARELEEYNEIRDALINIEGLNISSVIGMTLSEQLSIIRTSNIALSHYGASTFKYLYLLGIPTMHHGANPNNSFTWNVYNKDSDWVPSEIHMGEKVVSHFINSDIVDHPSRHNYFLDLEECELFFSSYNFKECLQ